MLRKLQGETGRHLLDNAGDTVSRETRLAGPARARRETAYFPINARLPLTMALRNSLPDLGRVIIATLDTALRSPEK